MDVNRALRNAAATGKVTLGLNESLKHILEKKAKLVILASNAPEAAVRVVRKFAAERDGYEAVKHQEFVGVGYFDDVTTVVTGGRSSTTALEGSTEKEQFTEPPQVAASAPR